MLVMWHLPWTLPRLPLFQEVCGLIKYQEIGAVVSIGSRYVGSSNWVLTWLSVQMPVDSMQLVLARTRSHFLTLWQIILENVALERVLEIFHQSLFIMQYTLQHTTWPSSPTTKLQLVGCQNTLKLAKLTTELHAVLDQVEGCTNSVADILGEGWVSGERREEEERMWRKLQLASLYPLTTAIC